MHRPIPNSGRSPAASGRGGNIPYPPTGMPLRFRAPWRVIAAVFVAAGLSFPRYPGDPPTPPPEPPRPAPAKRCAVVQDAPYHASMAAAIALALSYAGCETALHFGRKHNWDPAGAVAGFHVRSFGSEVVPEVASADVVALATFPEAVDDYRVTYAALLNASLAADGPLLLLMVHQPYLLPQHVPRTHPVWDAARRGRAVLLASGPHVARALAATVREHAGFEPPPISVVVNIPAASPPTAAVTKREHLCVQGKPEKSRRHYGLLFLALRHPSVHSMLRILNESLLLIGTRQRTAQNDLAQIPEDLPVRAVEDLPFTEFFSLLARCRAIITAFAHPRYVAEQSSSSVTTALHVGTPLLLESRALDSYNYLDRRGLWIYDDAAKWEQGSVPGPTTLPSAMLSVLRGEGAGEREAAARETRAVVLAANVEVARKILAARSRGIAGRML